MRWRQLPIYVELTRISTLYRVNELQLHWFFDDRDHSCGHPDYGHRFCVPRQTRNLPSLNLKKKDDFYYHHVAYFEHLPNNSTLKKWLDNVNRHHGHFHTTYNNIFEIDDYIYIDPFLGMGVGLQWFSYDGVLMSDSTSTCWRYVIEAVELAARMHRICGTLREAGDPGRDVDPD